MWVMPAFRRQYLNHIHRGTINEEELVSGRFEVHTLRCNLRIMRHTTSKDGFPYPRLQPTLERVSHLGSHSEILRGPLISVQYVTVPTTLGEMALRMMGISRTLASLLVQQQARQKIPECMQGNKLLSQTCSNRPPTPVTSVCQASA
jgi:hypothetical protein